MTAQPTDPEVLALLDDLKAHTAKIEDFQSEVARLSAERRQIIETLRSLGVSFPQMARHCGRSKSAFRYPIGKK